ncbi:putative E3 ubiquitin-protein ligase LIN-1 [Cucumis melo var. makuwa]|uniref:Putative E3 ubiquitin-protein ligase LIN-1 n=1 Tax=Cucumis melo var. makuwa TaxID=1194695 RepID=A0A5D3CXJ0_CUCMM|nr:putative E3 ubiquitin-protein ligase LIN-1 [Cucumis melo var. makuwa]
MSKRCIPIASSSSSPTQCPLPVCENERLDPNSIRGLVVSINQYIHEFLSNAEVRTAVKLRCTSKLRNQRPGFLEFLEQSIISNLYWGIENIEDAVQTSSSEAKATRLQTAEQMLQVPALVDEHGETSGMENRYLVCCSYFYLSIVKKLQGDEWQVALHFLQSLLVSPRLVLTEFAQEFCYSLLLSFATCSRQENFRSMGFNPSVEFGEGDYGESSIRQVARKYKDWLMYYQVMSYGETHQWQQLGSSNMMSSEDGSLSLHGSFSRIETSEATDCRFLRPTLSHYDIIPPLDHIDVFQDKRKASQNFPRCEDTVNSPKKLGFFPEPQFNDWGFCRDSSTKCMGDVLKDSHPGSPTSLFSSMNNSESDSDFEAGMNDINHPKKSGQADMPDYQKLQYGCSKSDREQSLISLSSASLSRVKERYTKANMMKSISNKFNGYKSRSLEKNNLETQVFQNFLEESEPKDMSVNLCKLQTFDSYLPSSLDQGSACQIRKQNSGGQLCQANSRRDPKSEILGLVEKAISRLCFSEGLGNYDDECAVEVSTVYKMLNNKTGVQYTMLKDLIMDQLVTGISTSKEEKVIRASVSLLTTIISENNSVIEDIKKKGLQLCDLATALKQNVHEAAILIYLISPSPREIKSLELLPVLVEIICTSKCYNAWSPSLTLTPPAASMMIIEVMVTAFDEDTNKMHLVEISSPSVLCGLLEVARTNNVEGLMSLGSILVKCMQLDGECRSYTSKFISVAPFLCLLESDKKEAVHIALQVFNEILHVPRSSAISLLQRIKNEGKNDVIHILMLCVNHLQTEYQLLAANLLIQLLVLDNCSTTSLLKEEAVQVLLRSVACEETSSMQLLSASILSTIGGTFSWTGEPYTVAWLLKKVGLSSDHQNMIKSFDWLDQSLQDAGMDSWCSLMARNIICIGEPVFRALEKGLKSDIKKVSRDCLTTIAWLGCEIAKSPNSIRCSACEILLSGIELFLHPGVELEERLLACLCIFNYTSGKGMQKLTRFSEGVRESLRRLSHITWMAEELHQVADYLMPHNSRISCVHTQVLELGFNSSGAVCALIFYKGLLFGGYSDGSIKGQSASLLWDIKKHRKAVTCFSHFESGESLLSGSADKTIRVWKMIQGRLECIEVIESKEQIQHLGAYGQIIFAVTNGHGLKVIDASRTTKVLFKSKNLKCIKVVQARVYAGCTDSSIQEFSVTNKWEQEIKPPSKSWILMHQKAINSLAVYKDWLFSASSMVQGSLLQNWRRHEKPEMKIITGKGEVVQAMSVVEDFVYIICKSLANSIQIWLRKAQHKVGRVSAGSKITCLLTANDMVLCGTETGKIKEDMKSMAGSPSRKKMQSNLVDVPSVATKQ